MEAAPNVEPARRRTRLVTGWTAVSAGLVAAAALALVLSRLGRPAPLSDADFVVAGIPDSADTALVRRLLGAPASVHSEENPLDPGARFVAWIYRDLTISFSSDGQRLATALHGPGMVTARGLRVGDPESTVLALYGRPARRDGADWTYVDPGRPLRQLAVSVRGGVVRRVFLGWLVD